MQTHGSLLSLLFGATYGGGSLTEWIIMEIKRSEKTTSYTYEQNQEESFQEFVMLDCLLSVCVFSSAKTQILKRLRREALNRCEGGVNGSLAYRQRQRE